MIKSIIKSFLNIILFPFKFLFQFIMSLSKRLRFSIALKISASYLLIYIVIIMIVTFTTTVGYLSLEFQKFENNVVNQDVDNIINDFPDINYNNYNSKIESIKVYDSNLNSVYPLNNEDRFADNFIVFMEKLIFNQVYTHAFSFYKHMEYYSNITYDVQAIISDGLKIFLLVAISGIIGLLLFVPIVSRTSYKMIGPIKNMTQITKTITVNNINTRLDVKGTQDELKELSQTFNDMMDRIEEGYKTQQQFVSDASHELRTPIAVIKGYVNMLDRWGKNDKAVLEESIAAIKNETESMQDLIEKLLFIARSDKSTLVFNKEDFKICSILEKIEKETKMIDNKHKFYFYFYHDVNMYADKNRIKQAIRILIDNAIKFTPDEGYIMISGFIKDDYYVIKIEDTGIGIEKKDMSKIFERLYRAEQSRSKQIGGHGLGLSIAKIIVVGHKGKIKVKSTVGKGSEFSIMLPYIK